jgi:hypothetical protein
MFHLNSFDMEGILVPMAFFATIVLVVYIFYTNRSKERLALINKEIGADLLNRMPSASLYSFKTGFFLIGLGLGSLAGNFMAMLTTLEDGVAYFSMLMLFGGMSLVVFYFLEKRLVKRHKGMN